jgi:hypothetical protein
MQDERTFTPHAQYGWLSWDEYSPEQDFCHFVGLLQRVLQPAVTLETGVGIGRLTGYLDTETGTYLGFESDPAWRKPPADPESGMPTAEQLADANLVILDSEPEHRFVELALWVKVGKRGSVCVVHDCGNGHAESSFHQALRYRIEATGIPGFFLNNPRGGWIGWHP